MSSGIDIKVEKTTAGYYDINILNGEIEGTDGLDSSILVSELTDARADESEVTDPLKRQGWIGNTVPPINGFELGSKLWLLDQARITQNTLNLAEDSSKKALEWMIILGAAKNIESEATQDGNAVILKLTITTPTDKIIVKYINLWENTINAA